MIVLFERGLGVLGIEAFGKALIETEDLDPVYCAIVGANLPKPQLARLLLAYWQFYHLGASAWLSEQSNFWAVCKTAARNVDPSPLGGRWPRGAERRHYRGQACIRAVTTLARRSPEVRFEEVAAAGSVEGVIDAMGPWPLFGGWIAYKAADMLERCAGRKVHFSHDVCLLYKEPRAGLLMLNADKPEQELERLLSVFRKFKAPPTADRACGVAEIETILCKWKSYMNGHYWVGKDIHEIRHGLAGWGKTAQRMLESSPPEVRRPGVLF